MRVSWSSLSPGTTVYWNGTMKGMSRRRSLALGSSGRAQKQRAYGAPCFLASATGAVPQKVRRKLRVTPSGRTAQRGKMAMSTP